MRHLKKINEQFGRRTTTKLEGRAKIINFCGQAEDIVHFDTEEFDDYDEPSNVDILSALGDLANHFTMSEDDLKLAIKDLSDRNYHDVAKMVGIILDDTIKESQRSANAKYILSKEDIKNIVQECYSDVPDSVIEDVLLKYENKKES